LTSISLHSLNDNGDVVFKGVFSGGAGIFTPTSLIAGTGDVIDGKTLTGMAISSLNDNGDVVFRGVFLGGNGVFTPTSLIAGTGDVIDGKTLTSTRSPSLNDNGDVVFQGFFTDGINAIILVDSSNSACAGLENAEQRGQENNEGISIAQEKNDC